LINCEIIICVAGRCKRKYFTIGNIPVVSSQNWNMVHGNTPVEVLRDLEGLQTMRTPGRKMAWLQKSIQAVKGAGVTPPETEERIWTNFSRWLWQAPKKV
jgi:hypothetical protein